MKSLLKPSWVLMIVAAGVSACSARSNATISDPGASSLAVAERLIDVFYSFDSVALGRHLASAPESAPAILYYQGWARGGNYRIVRRTPCLPEPDEAIRCAIQVEDDLIKALQLPLHVTDTFRMKVSGGAVRSVRTSSDDPPLFEEALQWVRKERAEAIEEPCKGFFAGGPTPDACVRVIVAGFAEFARKRRAN